MCFCRPLCSHMNRLHRGFHLLRRYPYPRYLNPNPYLSLNPNPYPSLNPNPYPSQNQNQIPNHCHQYHQYHRYHGNFPALGEEHHAERAEQRDRDGGHRQHLCEHGGPRGQQTEVDLCLAGPNDAEQMKQALAALEFDRPLLREGQSTCLYCHDEPLFRLPESIQCPTGEIDAARIVEQQPVALRLDAYPDRVFNGRVISVSAAARP